MRVHAGAYLCAKAMQALKKERKQKANQEWIDDNAVDGVMGEGDHRWPEGRPDTYRIVSKFDGGEELRLCPGSPIGELAFFSGDLQCTVRFFFLLQQEPFFEQIQIYIFFFTEHSLYSSCPHPDGILQVVENAGFTVSVVDIGF
jgi:hypothetical protein